MAFVFAYAPNYLIFSEMDQHWNMIFGKNTDKSKDDFEKVKLPTL